LEVVDHELKDVVHSVESKLEWGLEVQSVNVEFLLVSEGTFICRDILHF
jgi:hypothetical protein